MAVKEVIRMGHPTLREVAQKVSLEEINTPEFKSLIQDMFETMDEQDGIGIAAPQINVKKQVAIVGIINEGDEIDAMVVINPVITPLTEDLSGNWEGCLSVPGLRGYVERPDHIKVQFLDLEGVEHNMEFTGFPAIVFQHECDHLEGKLYVDRIKDPTKLSYLEEYSEFIETDEVDVEIEEEIKA
jgi:peptide deformylase